MDIKLSKRQACFRLEQNSAFKPHCTTGCDAGTRLPRLSASISLGGNSRNSSPAFPGQVTLRRLVTAGWDACVENWRNERDAGLFNVKPDCFHEFEWLVGFFSLQHHRRFLEKNSRNTHTGAQTHCDVVGTLQTGKGGGEIQSKYEAAQVVERLRTQHEAKGN